MDELVRWLGEQLDVEAQVAREATPGPWQNAPTARHHATASGRSEEAVFASPPDLGATVVAITGEAVERRHLVDAEHIAAHDPARVLREIDAKRRVLRDLEQAEFTLGRAESGTMPHDLMTGAVNTLRRIVRLHAAAYDQRPGYKEGWRP
ncbi:DUF6221 family protein [Streptomyces sp. NPDC001276]|uniref:DUF6221 family protein n=1 Tax=Streptomyces sp. NPDC001276 TaxID=3364555 RepID=UPI00368C5AD9